MVEKHPFGNFLPKKIKYLMLGSFVTKPKSDYEWFYANGRNQFWPIMEEVYGKNFKTKSQQQDIFVQLEMALSDIILSCERKNNSNLDVNLYNVVYNTKALQSIIRKYPLERIYFTSRHVENLFRKLFKEMIINYAKIELITLPSPSPRYAAMTKVEKVIKYKELLPKLK